MSVDFEQNVFTDHNLIDLIGAVKFPNFPIKKIFFKINKERKHNEISSKNHTKQNKKIKIEEEENCLVPVHCHTNSEGLQGMLILCQLMCIHGCFDHALG